MTHFAHSSLAAALLGAGTLAIAGCSGSRGAGERASTELVTISALQMAPIQETIQPARLAAFIGYYAPSPNTPDHELSWMRTQTGPLRQIESTIRRHGAAVRRDWIDGGRSNAEFIHLTTGITVLEVRDASGQLLMYSMRAPALGTSRSVTLAVRPTGVDLERLGQPCEKQDVYSGEHFRRVACITWDGISLSEHTEDAEGEIWSTSTASATRLTRRAVPLHLMLPAEFDHGAWLGDPSADDGKNYTVLLEAEEGETKYLIRRRQGWTAEEARNRDGSASIWAVNRVLGRSVAAQLGPGARPEALTYDLRASTSPNSERVEKLDRPIEMVLGLGCSWYDVMPNTHDFGRIECRTSDGMPLRIQTLWRGRIRIDAIATRFDRQQSSVADVLPPQAWTSPQAWGVPSSER